MPIDHTHDAARRSWLPSANAAGGDFPLQNLPFAVGRRSGSTEPFAGLIAIGDQALGLARLADGGLLDGLALDAAQACSQPALNDFFAMGPAAWRALRHAVFALLEHGVAPELAERVLACLQPIGAMEFSVPARIGDYTDFYTSIDHALNIGRLLRPEAPITPNFQWMPIAYHGRVSSIGVSGQRVQRPVGQLMPAGARQPVLGPCAFLDHEMELGIFIGSGNAAGQPIDIEQAEQHVFGICLLNDWSARDIQFWEMAPLGPFLSKNLATTISPWIVTMDALAPYRRAWDRPADHPQPLAYLDSAGNRAQGAIDIQLEVRLDTERLHASGAAPALLSRTSFRHQYWTVAQMVAHHTVGGCNLQPGDLLGSGTVSGPTEGEAGALIELSHFGRRPVRLPNGEQRSGLHDGDVVLMRGWCEAPGRARIGFGLNHGQVVPARVLPGTPGAAA